MGYLLYAQILLQVSVGIWNLRTGDAATCRPSAEVSTTSMYIEHTPVIEQFTLYGPFLVLNLSRQTKQARVAREDYESQ